MARLIEGEPALTPRQARFVAEYLRCWNASEAARRAGYAAHTARAQGSRLLTNVDVAAALQQRVAELQLADDEILVRLAEQARADVGDFLRVRGGADAGGADDTRAGGEVVIDLAQARRLGKTHLLKSVKQGRWGLEITLHDSQAALVHVAKLRGLYRERVELDGMAEMVDAARSLDEKLAALAAAGAGGGVSAQPE